MAGEARPRGSSTAASMERGWISTADLPQPRPERAELNLGWEIDLGRSSMVGVHGGRAPSSSVLDSRRRRAPSSSAPDSRRRGPRPRPHRTPAAAGPRPSRRASEEEEAATEEEDGGPPPHSSAIPPNTEAHGSVLRARGRKCCECRFGIENEFEFQCLNHPNSGIWCYPMPIPIPKPQYIHPNTV